MTGRNISNFEANVLHASVLSTLLRNKLNEETGYRLVAGIDERLEPQVCNRILTEALGKSRERILLKT